MGAVVVLAAFPASPAQRIAATGQHSDRKKLVKVVGPMQGKIQDVGPAPDKSSSEGCMVDSRRITEPAVIENRPLGGFVGRWGRRRMLLWVRRVTLWSIP